MTVGIVGSIDSGAVAERLIQECLDLAIVSRGRKRTLPGFYLG
jgi:hypothetical protein